MGLIGPITYDKIIYSQVKKTKVEVLSDAAWIVYEASIQMSGYMLTGVYMVGYNMRRPGLTESATKYSTKLENETVSTDGFSPYHASLGHITIRTSKQNMEFTPADSWITEGQHISWTSHSDGTQAVSLKIAWKLKAGNTTSFMRYIIYVGKIAKEATSDRTYDAPSYLGIAKVETFFVSDLDVLLKLQVSGLSFRCVDLMGLAKNSTSRQHLCWLLKGSK